MTTQTQEELLHEFPWRFKLEIGDCISLAHGQQVGKRVLAFVTNVTEYTISVACEEPIETGCCDGPEREFTFHQLSYFANKMQLVAKVNP